MFKFCNKLITMNLLNYKSCDIHHNLYLSILLKGKHLKNLLAKFVALIH